MSATTGFKPERVSDTWSCPWCYLVGQTMASDPLRTNLSAHVRVVHPQGRP